MDAMRRSARARAVRRSRAAAAWAFAFAVPSVYWAAAVSLGQPVDEVLGAGTIGGALTAAAADPSPAFLGVLWTTALAKVLAGLGVLALAAPWGRMLPRRPLRAAVAVAGWAMGLYGAANLLQRLLALVGVVGMPTTMSAATVRWHALLWDPVWLLGGVLFVAAARAAAAAER